MFWFKKTKKNQGGLLQSNAITRENISYGGPEISTR
jgi:hypothetical protein